MRNFLLRKPYFCPVLPNHWNNQYNTNHLNEWMEGRFSEMPKGFRKRTKLHLKSIIFNETWKAIFEAIMGRYELIAETPFLSRPMKIIESTQGGPFWCHIKAFKTLIWPTGLPPPPFHAHSLLRISLIHPTHTFPNRDETKHKSNLFRGLSKCSDIFGNEKMKKLFYFSQLGLKIQGNKNAIQGMHGLFHNEEQGIGLLIVKACNYSKFAWFDYLS